MRSLLLLLLVACGGSRTSPVTTAVAPAQRPPQGDACAGTRTTVLGVCDAHDPADCERRCADGNLRSCSNWGYQLEHGVGIPIDLRRAEVTYARACDCGVPGACANLASLVLRVSDDRARARRLDQRACDGGDTVGCANLGAMLENEGDFAKALGLYKKSCDAAQEHPLENHTTLRMRGCVYLGRLLEQGKGVAADPRRARDLYRDACDASCGEGCTWLGVLDEHGELVPKDLRSARAAYERGCDLDDASSCRNLGALYANGNGVPVDYARARDLFERACHAKLDLGCSSLGYLYEHGQGVPADPKRASELYDQGCKLGDSWGCGKLAELGRR